MRAIAASAQSKPEPAVRPRILFLTCHLPWPAISGGRRRELELIKRLSARFDVHVVAVSKTFEQDRGNVRGLAELCHRVEVFGAVPPVPRMAIGPQPAVVSRHHCPAATRRIAEILARDPVDVVHVEGFYLMQHVPRWTPVPVVLAEQNVEYDLERQRAGAVALEDRFGVLLQCLRTRRAEIEAWQRAGRLVAVTPEDQEMIQAAAPRADVRVVPDGGDHLPARPATSAPPQLARPSDPLLALVANFAYPPNVDAALHLHQNILPLINSQVPGVHLWLVGNDPPPQVRALAGERIRVTGRVDDTVDYLDAADVVVCPLRIGGGIKVKAIEALRRGKAMVTTAVGAQGLPSAARAAIQVADDPIAFAVAVAELLSDPAGRRELERRAARAATVLPTWDAAAAALGGIYDELVAATAAEWHDLMMAGGRP